MAWFLGREATHPNVRIWPDEEFPGDWRGEAEVEGPGGLAAAFVPPGRARRTAIEGGHRSIVVDMAGHEAEALLLNDHPFLEVFAADGPDVDVTFFNRFEYAVDLDPDCVRVNTSLVGLCKLPGMDYDRLLEGLATKTHETLKLLRPWVLRLARRIAREKELDTEQLDRWRLRSRCPRFAGKSVLRSPMNTRSLLPPEEP